LIFYFAFCFKFNLNYFIPCRYFIIWTSLGLNKGPLYFWIILEYTFNICELYCQLSLSIILCIHFNFLFLCGIKSVWNY
jgi:hypothetical protein